MFIKNLLTKGEERCLIGKGNKWLKVRYRKLVVIKICAGESKGEVNELVTKSICLGCTQ